MSTNIYVYGVIGIPTVQCQNPWMINLFFATICVVCFVWVSPPKNQAHSLIEMLESLDDQALLCQSLIEMCHIHLYHYFMLQATDIMLQCQNPWITKHYFTTVF